jgi:hypothetical protein
MEAQRNKGGLKWLLLVSVLLLGGGTVRAADFLRMESSYLGDGWFQYRVTLVEDPFYEAASIGAISVSFPGRTEYGEDPTHWSSSAAVADEANWSAEPQQSQARPYERTFLARSSHTTFKTVDQAVKFVVVATPQTRLQTAQVQEVAVILRLRGVVPCPPGDADGSEAVQSSSAALREDLRLTSLVMENGAPISISYEWTYDSTVSLEASFDLKSWTPVATIQGEDGVTTWNATTPLENAGHFYRLVLIANDQGP